MGSRPGVRDQLQLTFWVGVGCSASAAVQTGLWLLGRDWREAAIGATVLSVFAWLLLGLSAAAGCFASLAAERDGDPVPGATLGLIGTGRIAVSFPAHLVALIVFF